MLENSKVKTSKERVAVLEAENEILKAKLEFQNTVKQEQFEELISTNKELYSRSNENMKRLVEIATINAKLIFDKQIFKKDIEMSHIVCMLSSLGDMYGNIYQ
jgi:hypothetical protein